MQLSKIQERFKNTMLDHPKALDTLPQDFADVFEEGNIPLSARLKVYRNNIVGSLTDVVIATFPLMEKLVGKEFLEGMARSFVLKNPPQAGCLSTYGTGFDRFIESFEPAKSLPYLPEIAQLEIAMNEAYYAVDDTPLSAEKLSEIAPEDLAGLVLILRPSVTLLKTSYPLLAIKEFAESENQENPPDISRGGEFLMIFRPQLESVVLHLNEDEFAMFFSLQSGANLGEALEKTLETYPSFNLQDFLSKHLELETFSSLATNR